MAFYQAGVFPSSDSATFGRLPVFHSLRDLATAAVIRACTNGGHVAFCVQPVVGAVSARDGHLILTISDTTQLAALWRAQPNAFELFVVREDSTLARLVVAAVYQPCSAPTNGRCS